MHAPAQRPCAASAPLRTIALAEAHAAAGARFVAFAGHRMPLHYPAGLIAEHRWTRAAAGLFDVSHMGVAFVHLAARSGDGAADHRRIARLIEPLLSGDIEGLQRGALRYSLMLDPDGGIADDLLIGRPAEPALQGSLYLVVNAATKDQDFAHIAAALGQTALLDRRDGVLLALQGPQAAAVLARLCPAATRLRFLRFARFDGPDGPFRVSRAGYTGEDGFEILLRPAAAAAFWTALMADERVRPAGLGARDSLRLEAGLPLHGQDLGPGVSPIEAGLRFALSARRLVRGDLAGHARLTRELAAGPARLRVGLRILDGAPARAGAIIASGDTRVGIVTSGGFSPTLGVPIAMGFVPPALAAPGTPLRVVVRGRSQAAAVVPLPFVPHRYARNRGEGETGAIHPGS